MAYNLVKPSSKRITVRILNVYRPKEFSALNKLLNTKIALKIKNV